MSRAIVGQKPLNPRDKPGGKAKIVQVLPASCPSCCGAKREPISTAVERSIPGLAPNGKKRTHLVWRRVRCTDCQQTYMQTEHQVR